MRTRAKLATIRGNGLGRPASSSEQNTRSRQGKSMDAGVPNAERREPAESSIRLPSSLRDRIGQMIMVGFRGMTAAEAEPTMRNIEAGSVGWVLLFDVDAET